MTEKETVVCLAETSDPKREEEAIVLDAEKARAGEVAEAEERAGEVADGVVLPVSPEDVEEDDPSEGRGNREMDFDDPADDEEDHGRGLV